MSIAAPPGTPLESPAAPPELIISALLGVPPLSPAAAELACPAAELAPFWMFRPIALALPPPPPWPIADGMLDEKSIDNNRARRTARFKRRGVDWEAAPWETNCERVSEWATVLAGQWARVVMGCSCGEKGCGAGMGRMAPGKKTFGDRRDWVRAGKRKA